MELISQTNTNPEGYEWGTYLYVFGVFLHKNDIRNKKIHSTRNPNGEHQKKRAIPNLLDWNIPKKLLKQMYKLRLIQ